MTSAPPMLWKILKRFWKQLNEKRHFAFEVPQRVDKVDTLPDFDKTQVFFSKINSSAYDGTVEFVFGKSKQWCGFTHSKPHHFKFKNYFVNFSL